MCKALILTVDVKATTTKTLISNKQQVPMHEQQQQHCSELEKQQNL